MTSTETPKLYKVEYQVGRNGEWIVYGEYDALIKANAAMYRLGERAQYAARMLRPDGSVFAFRMMI